MEIYFDNSATTPVCRTAREAAISAMTDVWANPSSLHSAGFAAERELTRSRDAVLAALGSNRTRGRLVFCASGSEANNLALLGAARAKTPRAKRIILSDSEHPSVSEQARALARAGWETVYIPTHGGKLDFDAFCAALTGDTALVSLMLVNNETGAVYDVAGAFAAARKKAPAALLHCDAVQGFLKIPFSVHRLGCDALTVSAHKIGGLKGVGALWFSPELELHRSLSPVVYGGGQENGLRSGTENMPGICAFGAAVDENRDTAAFGRTTLALTERIIRTLSSADRGITFNLPPVRAPHILSITNPRVKSETLVHALSARGIYVSAGSACASHGKHGSGVLPAFGLSEEEAGRTVRVSLSSLNTEEEADIFTSALLEEINCRAGKR